MNKKVNNIKAFDVVEIEYIKLNMSIIKFKIDYYQSQIDYISKKLFLTKNDKLYIDDYTDKIHNLYDKYEEEAKMLLKLKRQLLEGECYEQ